jgi:hypothetical protein
MIPQAQGHPMTEKSMLERLARTAYEHHTWYTDWDEDTFRMNDDEREHWRTVVRAVLHALTEPSDEFLDECGFHDGEHSRSGETYPVQRNFIRAYVTAILSEPNPSS